MELHDLFREIMFLIWTSNMCLYGFSKMQVSVKLWDDFGIIYVVFYVYEFITDI